MDPTVVAKDGNALIGIDNSDFNSKTVDFNNDPDAEFSIDRDSDDIIGSDDNNSNTSIGVDDSDVDW